ncbi:MAG: alkaline phosphatase [Christensenellaceae bacterium]|nr:alkaline phosphatase [Christensenellaceae bacterium]
MKKLLALLLVVVLGLSCATFVTAEEAKAPKYVFMFIGDGMGTPQITATEYYLSTIENADKPFPMPRALSFTTFPYVGIMTTMDATSFLPDSASTASSMASGIKTASGVINYTVNDALETQEPVKTITEYAKEAGKKIGIVTSVTTNHATPAAYYAKVPSRNQYYDIAKQFVESKVDFIGGGGFGSPDNKGKDKNIYEVAAEANINIVDGSDAIRNIEATDERTIAKVCDGAMLYEVDRLAELEKGNDIASLADVTKAAIKAVDNDENGFFIMVEGGKIDWACHANDAYTSIMDTVAISDAVQVAIDFMDEHPDETLIVVTGDHETGGLTIGFATTEYDSHYEVLANQKLSYEKFTSIIASWREEGGKTFEEALAFVKENYGLTTEADQLTTLTDTDIQKLKEAFEVSMSGLASSDQTAAQKLAYGGYEPFSMIVSRIINNKAGLDYTSYSHTGLQIPVFAKGVGSELFTGLYDNTDIFSKTMTAMRLADKISQK